VEEKALFKVLSATVYAETAPRSSPAAARQAGIVAFGDPDYKGSAGAAGAVHAGAAILSSYLAPLPATRGEAEAVGALFAPRARLFLGGEATETRAKALGTDASFVHFACHGFSDERFPLDSGLALTTPSADVPGDNGYLQAWEVFEAVRLDADLVALSACDTAMGRELGGEGLLGLTRAFQYAGARCVLSSLWSVADRSTAALMARFYTHLRAGLTPAESLRKAQVEMIRSAPPRGRGGRPSAPVAESHPFNWSGFILEGRGV
jgi:CHAT domain-containing protein